MRPIEFPEQNSVFAKDQQGYMPLPVYYDKEGERGGIVSLWALSIRERLKVLITGRMYLLVITFHEPLQPVKMATRRSEVFTESEV
ncbi:MAG: hypothetical protein KDD67_13915 [Ignavibacteriae bacterium]|nr:hypothetical protein [Ignavibacteriota bacterium]MCB9216116.1 hypothetical protein [Ignavibacteria bacterium]